MVGKKLLYSFLLFFFLVDTTYSFKQHYSKSLDGDMAGGIVPSEEVLPVLNDPFGIKIILTGEKYPNPNRYFSHWLFKEYFTMMPIFLQKFTSPVESIYLSCAIIKTLIQVLIILFLSAVISGTWNLMKMEFLIAIVLIFPMFQTNGFARCMGIIDSSISYSFFYALPAALLIIYFAPLLMKEYHDRGKQDIIMFLMLPLAVVICFSGPLNTGVILIISALIISKSFLRIKSNESRLNFVKLFPGWFYFYIFPVMLLSAYSLYIGRFNSINDGYYCPLGERYSRLPAAIYYQLTHDPGYPLLILVIILNSILIRRTRIQGSNKIMAAVKLLPIFSFIYILLLPLGGYREWRHEILRYDTLIPVTLSLIFVFGISTLFLIRNLTTKTQKWYIPLIAVILLIYTVSDESIFTGNSCEKEALITISKATENIVPLKNDCPVVSWGKITRPEDSELNGRLLEIWRITDENKLYYNIY